MRLTRGSCLNECGAKFRWGECRPNPEQTPPLVVEDLSVSFRRRHHDGGGREIITPVVREVSFDLHAGETVALVGESGSGKSLTALSLLQLLPYPEAFHPGGSVRYHGDELVNADADTLQRIRGNEISMIFQEPMTALNPLHTVEKANRRIPRRAPRHGRRGRPPADS